MKTSDGQTKVRAIMTCIAILSVSLATHLLTVWIGLIFGLMAILLLASYITCFKEYSQTANASKVYEHVCNILKDGLTGATDRIEIKGDDIHISSRRWIDLNAISIAVQYLNTCLSDNPSFHGRHFVVNYFYKFNYCDLNSTALTVEVEGNRYILKSDLPRLIEKVLSNVTSNCFMTTPDAEGAWYDTSICLDGDVSDILTKLKTNTPRICEIQLSKIHIKCDYSN